MLISILFANTSTVVCANNYDVDISPAPVPATSEWEIPNLDELVPFNPLTKFSMLLMSLPLGLEVREAGEEISNEFF